MKKLLSLILICIASTVYGGIETYFKKALNKESHHDNPMPNIDFAYIINLDQRPEKYEHSINELARYDITPYRFSAVNGWELSLEALNSLGVRYERGMISNLWGTCYLPENEFQPFHEIMHVIGRNYYGHCMSRGAIGCNLSHLSVLEDAYNSGYNTIWVMEDDIEIIRNPHILSELIAKLDAKVGKNRWDILYTDRDTKNSNGEYVPCSAYAPRPDYIPKKPTRFSQKSQVGKDFRKIGARYGTYSMIVRRSGMKKILDYFKRYQIFLPYDMELFQPNNVEVYTVTNDVVSTQARAASDNGGPNYENSSAEQLFFFRPDSN